MHKILVEVRGGVVQEIYSDAGDLQITLLDWDAGDRPGDAFVGGDFPPAPQAAMPEETAGAYAILRRSRGDKATKVHPASSLRHIVE